jgi:glycine/D-amino acid oxidase-like deaminating enzyme
MVYLCLNPVKGNICPRESRHVRIPTHARVVIVGGGIMGVGLAYHLAHEGWGADTVLLEKAELTSGSDVARGGADHAFDLVLQLGKCVDYNIGLYSGALEAETGQAVTWHGCGSFRLAYTEDEMDWLRHTLSVGRSLGLQHRAGRPRRVAELHPFYNLDGVLGALHTPDDGHVDPTNVTMAMAAGARAKGARIIRRCRATNITKDRHGRMAGRDRAGHDHLRTCGQRGRHLCAADGRMVRAATADDLDDAPLLRHRRGAGIPRSRHANCR